MTNAVSRIPESVVSGQHREQAALRAHISTDSLCIRFGNLCLGALTVKCSDLQSSAPFLQGESLRRTRYGCHNAACAASKTWRVAWSSCLSDSTLKGRLRKQSDAERWIHVQLLNGDCLTPGKRGLFVVQSYKVAD
jgi:hypothetical protein